MMKVETISYKEASKKLELVWNELDEDDKLPYLKIAELDKIRYQNDEYNAKSRPIITAPAPSIVIEPL